MNREELKLYLTEHYPAFILDEAGETLNIIVPVNDFKGFMEVLRNEKSLDFNFLTFLTCIDWKDHFMMVYHMFSRNLKHELVVKVKLENRDQAEIETVCDIWRTAESHEREVFDLFGVKFLHHPDLRRLFLDDDWKGHPLRKDYTDENMIEI